MSDLKHQIALTALNNMMAGGHFNICTVDSVGKLLGIQAGGDAYDTLRPLHCIDWSRMPAEVKEAVPGLIQECLGIAPVYQFSTVTPTVIDVSGKPAKRSFLRLLGGRP